MERDLSQAAVCIVGLGLMGGSLGLVLRRQHSCRTVIGYDRRAKVCRSALEMGAADTATTDMAAAVRQADIVVLAAPVRTIVRLVGELGPALPPGAILIDVGSTKAAVVKAMEGLPPHVQAIGGHPMCGKERSGIEAADAELYLGAVFCLTPLARTSPESLALARQLVQASGARPFVLDAERHDALVAIVSHLPYLMATALTAAAGDAAADVAQWQLAASGFRDTSRLSGSDVDMMVDILLTNQRNVAPAARAAALKLSALAGAIEDGNEPALRAMLTRARDIWKMVYG